PADLAGTHPEHMKTLEDLQAQAGKARCGPDVATVSVAELLAAWHAVADGQFAYATAAGDPTPGSTGWCPVAVAVLGCHGSAGASTLALSLATAAGEPVRVVEAAAAGASGLAGAATAELGPTGTGWVRG